MESSIVGAKGQVVIPKKIRAMFRIKQGTRVHFEVSNGEIVLTPPHAEVLRAHGGLPWNALMIPRILEQGSCP